MPRITAPTLAEHRDRRRAALLAAAREIAIADSGAAVTMAAVAERTGLSRPAVYEYFSSSEDLVGAVLLDEMRRWSDEVARAVDRARSPRDKVRAYVRVSLRMVAEGRHDIAAAVGPVRVPRPAAAELEGLHRALAAPLTRAVAALSEDDPVRGVHLLQGVVEAAARRLQAGGRLREETRAAEAFVLAGLGAAAGSRTAADQRKPVPRRSASATSRSTRSG